MKTDRATAGAAPRRGCRFWRRTALLLVAPLVAALGGCRFLADEFSVYDRQAPAALVRPDAAVSALADRP
ncbi:MAG: hypothetical protein JNL08_12530 [Planctomycetes bacterium]|nr:hypothetical protein [Planctomycetota bacterium]